MPRLSPFYSWTPEQQIRELQLHATQTGNLPNMSTTEIKPVGLDCSDPTTELRRAFINVIDGLYLDLQTLQFGTNKTSAEHLRWMCKECLIHIKTMPVDKLGRWVGFIQGVMACNGVLDVDAERDRTRPIFEAAYKAQPR